MRSLLLTVIVVLIVSLPTVASAHPVINEVMWMGTDLSSADEWLEVLNPDTEDIDLTGWSVTSVNTGGKEIIVLRFATGTVLEAGGYLVIAAKSAANSRLKEEPFAVSSTLTLPNTKLLLRLRNAQSDIIDEVDDGIGAPFAGENPSGTGAKASMERIDPAVAGTLKENWKTATATLGFDENANVLGTPGSGLSEAPEPFSPPALAPIAVSSSSSACSDPLEIAIAVQSGPLLGVGKVTVNFQAVATVGSLSGVSCSWSYGDGFVSASCNPPVHSFTVVGTYNIRLEAKNQCGTTLIQEQVVQVQPDPAVVTGSTQTIAWYDGSKLLISGALPNPVGTDTGKEWIEIRNLEDRPVELRGWKLTVGETSVRSYPLKDFIAPHAILRLYDSESTFKLPNTPSKLQLITPSGSTLSTVPWKQTDEGRVYRSDDIRSVTVRGRVLRVTGPVTFMLQLEGEAAALLGDDSVTVRILGLEPNPDAVIVNDLGQLEFLRALIENKNIELQFDTELWDDMGRLLAHVYTEQGFLAETRMIHSRLWTVDSELPHAKRGEFEELERSLRASSSPEITRDDAPLHLSITEIYPAPFAVAKGENSSDWKTEEWLELENSAQKSVDLSGWTLTTERSKKPLPQGLKIASGSRLILRTASIGLGLRNAGDTVNLVSPDGTTVASLTYPALKNGMAFILTDDGVCTTMQPTPGDDNACVLPATKKPKAQAIAKKPSAAKKVSHQVRAYAASYRAQVDTDPAVHSRVIAVRNRSEEFSVMTIVFAFTLGLGVAVAGMFTFQAFRPRFAVVEKR